MFSFNLINYSSILKWNHVHYGAGDSHGGGRFAPKDYDDPYYDDGSDTDGSDTDDLETYLNKKSKVSRVYDTDPKDIHEVFKQFERDGCKFNGTALEMSKKWKAVTPNLHPHEFLRAFFGKDGVTNTNVGNLKLNIDTKARTVDFASRGAVLVHGEKVLDYQRILDFGNHGVEHSRLEVDPSSQGNGLVKKLFKSCIPLYEKLGLSHIVLYANIDRGGYAWGKYGFSYFDEDNRDFHQKETQKKLTEVTSNVKLNASASKEIKAITKVLQGKSLDSIWALTDIKTPHLDKLFEEHIKKDSSKGSFVKLLLKDSSWAGVMDIQKTSMAKYRLDKYLGLKVTKEEEKGTFIPHRNLLGTHWKLILKAKKV